MPAFFTQHLLKWHARTPRPLPWDGGPRDPYHIWISEIIMQQTRIEQGTPYYLRFISRFPSVQSLAEASQDEVLKYWQGLGYYSRARNLHKAAGMIVSQGQFPNTYEGLLRLPGIGPYSAAAIASFAYDLPYPVVDGNVKRVIARFCGIHDSIDQPSGHENIRLAAVDFIRGVSPGQFNQAIMNFGALVCKPRNPLCDECPLAGKCFAFQNHKVEPLPVRSKSNTNRDRYLHFIVFRQKQKCLLIRREEKDIWKGLYTPPWIETTSIKNPSVARLKSLALNLFGHQDISIMEATPVITQKLSHQTIHGRFHFVDINSPPQKSTDNSAWVSSRKIAEYPRPKMVAEKMLIR